MVSLLVQKYLKKEANLLEPKRKKYNYLQKNQLLIKKNLKTQEM